MFVGWMFGGVGCHVISKCAELCYKLGYLITVALFCPVYNDHQGLSVPAKVYLKHPHYDLPSS